MKRIRTVVQRDAWRYRLAARDESALVAAVGPLKDLTPRAVEKLLNAAQLRPDERGRLMDVLDAAAERAGCYGDEPHVAVRRRGKNIRVSALTGAELFAPGQPDEESEAA